MIQQRATSRAFLAVCAALLLASCESLSSVITPVSTATATVETDLEETLSELAPQRLRAGECGMFLWTRTSERKLVMFSKAVDNGAMVMLNGREQNVPRVSGDGRIVMGYNAQQSYVWRGLFLQVNIEFEQRSGLGRGAVIPTGTIRMSRRDGWEYVVPVGGLIACEAK